METLSERVTNVVRDWILHGKIKPGERIEEVPLALKLNVSRTPVRAALATLASEGLIEHRPKRGYEVRVFNVEEVASAYEVRAALEGLASGMAAKRGVSLEVKEELLECLAIGDEILKRGYLDPSEHQAYQAMNIRFHNTLLAAAGNTWLDRFVAMADNIPYASGRIVLWDVEYELILHSHKDHHRIVEAVLSQDTRRAEALMREHIYYAGIILRKQYDRQEQKYLSKGNNHEPT